MAFRLQRDEPIRGGIRRLAKAELESAFEALKGSRSPADDAIHEARKSVKKVRAILHLIDEDDGRRLNGCRKRLQAVSRTLSQVRDADAMVKILDKLRKRNPRALSGAVFARLRRRLLSHKRDMMRRAAGDGTWKKAARTLRKLRRSAKRWRPAHRQFAALAAGIADTYRRGRVAMRRAQTRGKAPDFHGWRKEIKALWYELRLLEGCGRRIQHDVAVLHHAETWLGDDHNIVVLCEGLSKDPSGWGSGSDLDKIQRASVRYQYALRKRTLATTHRLFERKPSAFVHSLEQAWTGWHVNRAG